MLLCLGLYVEQLWKTPIWKSSINNSLCDFRCAATPQCMPWPCHCHPCSATFSFSNRTAYGKGFNVQRSPIQFFIVAVHQLPSTSINFHQDHQGYTRGIPSSTPSRGSNGSNLLTAAHGLTPKVWSLGSLGSTGSGGILWFFNGCFDNM